MGDELTTQDVDNAYAAGLVDGKEEGAEDAYAAGFADGTDHGAETGYIRGFDDGYDEAIADVKAAVENL